MQFLDRAGVGTLWSICKEKFALTGHTHNYAGSGSPGGSANSAIGVVDYNNTDKTIQIGYSGAGISGDEIKYIAGYTSGGGGGVNAKIKDVSKDALKSWLGLGSLAYNSSIDWSQISGVPTATTTQSGIMSAADKAKLNGIASGANNYSLPVSSNTTLGGIKVSMPAYDTGTRWPIVLYNNGVAYTSINGLNKNNFDGSVENVIAKNNKYSTTYSSTKIQIRDMSQNKSALLDFPSKSGTLALLSDITDASNLCRFNFINSISECKSDRINFLLGFTGDIDITPLFSCNNGTILFMVTSDNIANVGITSGNWSINMEDYDYYTSLNMYKGELCLATVYNSKIFFFQIIMK